EWFSSQIAQVRDDLDRPGRESPYRPNGKVREAHFHYLCATFTINVLPAPTNLLAFAFVPLSPGRTLTISDYFFGDDAGAEQIADLMALGQHAAGDGQA